MSGTRSLFPPEPATNPGSEALLIAAHGDCGGPGGNVLASELARRARLSGRYSEVAIGYLRCSPTIEEAAASLKSNNISLFPLFMSNGYYVGEAIPKRLGLTNGVDALGREVRIQEPLGLHPDLPNLLLTAATDAAMGKTIDPKSATLLLVAHGSASSPDSSAAAQRICRQMADRNLFKAVELSFLEEEPFFVPTLQKSDRPTFVLGLFAGEGMHGGDDIHNAIAALTDPKVHVIEQLGSYAMIIELVLSQLHSARMS
jgi:sirohydrochlorin cobaltochelatase